MATNFWMYCVILFPHLFEDLEFLVPPQHDIAMDDAVVIDVSEGISQMHVNTVELE